MKTRSPLAFSITFLAAAAFGVNASAIELAVNGDFETGDFTGWSLFESGPGQQTVTSVNPSSGIYAGQILNTQSGSNSLMKQANLAAGLLLPGQEVTVSFDARGSFGVGGVAFAQIFSELDGGGVSKAEFVGGGPLAVNADENIWTSFSMTTTLGPDVSGGVTLQLEAVNAAIPGEFTSMWYDNVSIQVESLEIPEPTSAVLVSLGGIALAFRRRVR